MSNHEASSSQQNETPTDLPCSLSCGLVAFSIIGVIVVLILLSPTITQFGYCRGWWLQSSPWAYYWWLCECPTDFEQSLYPDNIEVVVSACRNPQTATLSLDGRYMIVGVGANKQGYLLNFANDTIQRLPYQTSHQNNIVFWTDTLAYISKNRQLFDATDQTIINLIRFRATKEGNSITLSPEALQAFQEANQVLLRKDYHVALALNANPSQHPDNNYLLSYLDIRQEQLTTFLVENGIDYEIFEPCSDKASCISHNGQFEMRWPAISTLDGKVISEISSNPSFRRHTTELGWAYDDSGIYLHFYKSAIIEGGMVLPSRFPLRQPIVKLKVPEEYR